MRKRIQIVIVALCAVIMLSLIGYLILHLLHGAKGNYPEPVHIDNAVQIYNNAVTKARNHSDLDLHIENVRHTTAHGQIYVEQVEQFITYYDMYSEQMTAVVEEIQTIDGHSFTALEHFAGETIYVDIEGSCFSATSNANAFRARYAPAITLNAELYSEITGFDTGSMYVITFKSPTEAEAWIDKDSITLSETWGVAYVTYSGMLAGSTYYVSYEESNAVICRAVTVNLDYEASEFDIPSDTSDYTPVSYIDGPKALEIACGYLLSSQNISAQSNDTIFFEAYGDKRLQQINISASSDNDLTARVDTIRTLENTSHIGELSTYKQTQLFENGTYHVSENGADFNVDETVSESNMQSYYQNLLVSTVMLPKYISGAEQSVKNGIMTVMFSATDAFADQIVSNACQTLYQKPDLMDTLESSHMINSLTAYIEINTVTGIPVSSGISYTGTHNINNFNYQLQYTIDQTYHIGS